MPVKLDDQLSLQVSFWFQMNTTDEGSASFPDSRARSNEVAEYDAQLFALETMDNSTIMEVRIVQKNMTCSLITSNGTKTIQITDFEFES